MTPPEQRRVAIPRLQRPHRDLTSPKDRRRVSRACTACRFHKTKCTGETPQCKYCAAVNQECVYIMPRKDRLKIMTERCQQMAGLLRGLKTASVDNEAVISPLLDAVEEDIEQSRQATVSSGLETGASGSQESRDSGVPDSRDKSDSGFPDLQDELDTESFDRLGEDLHVSDQARATGFVGASSEVQWLRAATFLQPARLHEQPEAYPRRDSHTSALGSKPISAYSFWADGESVDVDSLVDPYDMPRPDVAERLLSCYMSRVHDAFPILHRRTFEDQFRNYFAALTDGNAPRLSPKWQAILNLVFAIGARYSDLSSALWRADPREHLVYQVRARSFGLNDATMTTHPDVPQIQSLGLLAFYWLSIGQVSRAWGMIGLAVRYAYTLGLHVRNDDPSATASKRETLVRTWWSLYSLESTLCIITGRPRLILDASCSVPLPMAVPEGQISDHVDSAFRSRRSSSTNFLSAGLVQTNPGSYFKASVQLSIITQSILTSTLKPTANPRLTGEVERRIDDWLSSLPPDLHPLETLPTSRTRFHRDRTLLAFQLSSAKVLLYRPYLPPQPSATATSHQLAQKCLAAAKQALDLLPDTPSLAYDDGPWWMLVHHTMQALAALLLGLGCATPPERAVLARYVETGIERLRGWGDESGRACAVATRVFETVLRCRGDGER